MLSARCRSRCHSGRARATHAQARMRRCTRSARSSARSRRCSASPHRARAIGGRRRACRVRRQGRSQGSAGAAGSDHGQDGCDRFRRSCRSNDNRTVPGRRGVIVLREAAMTGGGERRRWAGTPGLAGPEPHRRHPPLAILGRCVSRAHRFPTIVVLRDTLWTTPSRLDHVQCADAVAPAVRPGRRTPASAARSAPPRAGRG